MQRTIESLPGYLRKYCVEQPGDKYTPKDHAAWRYIMRQSRAYFKEHAVPIYLDGLARTGISFDRIPMIAEMDAKLKLLGWGAVPVCGFIPPAAFLDFQARRILPIASDMRSVDHIAYTPAPDIVHEAAGHAPIIADPAYSAYLTKYAAMAQKAIFVQEDLDLYEAIRTLSDVKENPDSTKAIIDAAEVRLKQATASVKVISEAAKVARMNWWTVEYGLLGSLEDPKIYGAGLLSSVGESQACLTDKVRKIRLTTACVDQAYDITEPQPQLFVGEDIGHLTAVLEEFEKTLSYVRGGVYGLTQAREGRTVTTTVLDSGIQISGRLDSFLGAVHFVRYTGPVQLAHGGVELAGQSVAQHAQGFSSPLGRWRPHVETAACRLTDEQLAKAGVAMGKKGTLELTSGFKVDGTVAEIVRKDGRLVLVKFRDCRVTRGAEIFFQPDWGDFDMAVGEAVTSVMGGPADRERYGSHDVGQSSTTPGRTSPFTADEKAAFKAYAEVRALRDEIKRTGASGKADRAMKLMDDAAKRFPHDWLLRLETIELGHMTKAGQVKDFSAGLLNADQSWLVKQGTALATVAD